ncbi:hypothetical protein EMIT053CA3_60111 [Pseudomonas donghuensis]
MGRKNWLFVGSLRSGKRVAAIMSLIQSGRLNGHEPYAYLKDVLTRVPTSERVKSVTFYRINGCRPNLHKVSWVDAYPNSIGAPHVQPCHNRH